MHSVPKILIRAWYRYFKWIGTYSVTLEKSGTVRTNNFSWIRIEFLVVKPVVYIGYLFILSSRSDSLGTLLYLLLVFVLGKTESGFGFY